MHYWMHLNFPQTTKTSLWGLMTTLVLQKKQKLLWLCLPGSRKILQSDTLYFAAPKIPQLLVGRVRSLNCYSFQQNPRVTRQVEIKQLDSSISMLHNCKIHTLSWEGLWGVTRSISRSHPRIWASPNLSSENRVPTFSLLVATALFYLAFLDFQLDCSVSLVLPSYCKAHLKRYSFLACLNLQYIPPSIITLLVCSVLLRSCTLPGAECYIAFTGVIWRQENISEGKIWRSLHNVWR